MRNRLPLRGRLCASEEGFSTAPISPGRGRPACRPAVRPTTGARTGAPLRIPIGPGGKSHRGDRKGRPYGSNIFAGRKTTHRPPILSFRGGAQPPVGIRSLFPGPGTHIKGMRIAASLALLAMTDSELRSVLLSPVIPRRPQADVGIRSLFPRPAPHTRGCGLPRRIAPRNDSFLICVRFISLLSFRGGRRPTWESVLFFPVPHRTQGDADCRVASLLAMTVF